MAVRSLLLLLLSTLPLHAAELRVLPPGEVPRDHRLGPAKALEGYFPFQPSPTPADWQARAEAVRMQLRVALGLWPEPQRTSLNAVVHGRIDCGEYTVEKVAFESMPGFFVTGNLYRPKDEAHPDRKFPVILNPHGHWTDGRFIHAGDNEVRQQLAAGAEKFENAARSLLQARAVQLARMGCIVFHYDMLGYADSTQISLELAHKFATQRPEMNTRAGWGLFSPEAEAHAQSVLGLQIWNGVRALDFLLALPDADPQRVGMTGASGGGTQTMLLSAIDPRITVSCPAVMVSTAMQGGCTCENASLLRVDTGNVEFAALFAPKPLAMTAANDWTKEMATKGFPQLQKHWALLGAPEQVQLTALLQFPHNYNSPSRAAMDRWFNRYLSLGLSDEALAERDFRLLTRAEMTVWDDEHPAPDGGPAFERQLLRWWNADAQQQMLASPEAFQKIAAPAAEVFIGHSVGERGATLLVRREEEIGSVHCISGLTRLAAADEEIPTIFLRPKDWTGAIALWLDPHGKAALFNDAATLVPTQEIQTLLDSGIAVAGADLLEQGEFLLNGQEPKMRRVSTPREAGAYTYGYNASLFAERARDVQTLVHLLRRDPNLLQKEAPEPPRRVAIVALGDVGPIGAAARALAGDAVAAAVIGKGNFRFAGLTDLWSPDFLPAAAKYGDLPGLLALATPRPLFLLGEIQPAPLLAAAYRARNADDKLRVAPGGARTQALDWLKETLRAPVTP